MKGVLPTLQNVFVQYRFLGQIAELKSCSECVQIFWEFYEEPLGVGRTKNATKFGRKATKFTKKDGYSKTLIDFFVVCLPRGSLIHHLQKKW